MSYFSSGKKGLFRTLCQAYASAHNIKLQGRAFKPNLFDHALSRTPKRGHVPDITQADFVRTQAFVKFVMDSLYQDYKHLFVAIGYPNVSFFHYMVDRGHFGTLSAAMLCEEIDETNRLKKRRFYQTTRCA